MDELLTDQFQLRYLSRDEIKDLVNKLEEHNSLGPYLKEKTFEQRVDEFEKKAGRQLLVALHEATSGIPFQEIIYDEYKNIIPKKARKLYLTICILNQFNIPVRAGLISRVYDINFEKFKNEFLGPLEHVVRIKELWPKGDYGYIARHSEIAQMVFEEVLSDPVDRYNEIAKVLAYLNISYSSDSDSFKKLMRAKTLYELFPDHQDIISLFDIAQDAVGNDSYLLQQMANYERLRKNGNYHKAKEYLERALVIDPDNNSLIHTLAEVLKSQSEESGRYLQRYKLREEARSHLDKILNDHSSGKYARVTYIKLAINDLSDVLSKNDYDDSEVEDWIRKIEKLLEEGKQKFPGDQYILNAESEFSKLLEDHKRSKSALESAYQVNPRDPFIAGRLSRIYEEEGDIEKSIQHLSNALESNANDKRLNYQYASTLRKKEPENIELLEYHFRRSYTEGDSNHKAKFWHARYLYESDDPNKRKKSKLIFKELRNVQIAHDEKIKIRDYIYNKQKCKRFNGTIDRVESAYGFIKVSGTNDSIFFHESDVVNEAWNEMKSQDMVNFIIGFNYKGPSAIDVNLE